MSEPLLPELPESQATGRTAEIYAEIRAFSGVAYVSSLQRYLATLPGVLEWAWDAVRPAMASGAIQQAGWNLATTLRLPPAHPLSHPHAAEIRNIAANFVRVSPVNLMMGACLTLLLTGTRPNGQGFPHGWQAPEKLPPMPGNVDPATQPLLMRFATQVNGTPFVPALYRQIAQWPDALAWLAGEIVPRFTAPETVAARAQFRAAARAAAPAIVDRLPPVPPPDPTHVPSVQAAIDRYGETSPEMCLFGQLILDAVN